MRLVGPMVPLVVAALAASALAAAPDFTGMQIQPYDPPRAAPDFALPDLQGRTVRSAELAGKVQLLYFWTTY